MTLCFFAEGTILEGVTLCLVRREPLPKLFQRDVVGRDNVTGRENGIFASKTGNLLENSLPGFVRVNVIRLPGGKSAKIPNVRRMIYDESAKNIMAGATGKRFLRKPVTGTAER